MDVRTTAIPLAFLLLTSGCKREPYAFPPIHCDAPGEHSTLLPFGLLDDAAFMNCNAPLEGEGGAVARKGTRLLATTAVDFEHVRGSGSHPLPDHEPCEQFPATTAKVPRFLDLSAHVFNLPSRCCSATSSPVFLTFVVQD